MKVFTELNLIEVLSDQTIYMAEIEKMVGSETYWAEQKRISRKNQPLVGQSQDNVKTVSEPCPTCPSKSKSKSKSKEKDIKTYSEIPTVNEAILSFIEFRKGIKSPMTDHAIDLLIKELNKLSSDGQTQIAILNQSIMRGWKGVFALKEDNAPQQHKQNKFNQFPQRTYTAKDYEELERKLINRT
jgi:hypothetical protein